MKSTVVVGWCSIESFMLQKLFDIPINADHVVLTTIAPVVIPTHMLSLCLRAKQNAAHGKRKRSLPRVFIQPKNVCIRCIRRLHSSAQTKPTNISMPIYK